MNLEQIRQKEKREQIKLQNEMSKQRSKQLMEANIAEDKTIKQLEKQLKLNKRKSKSVPKSFSVDGLDCILFFLFINFEINFNKILILKIRFIGSM